MPWGLQILGKLLSFAARSITDCGEWMNSALMLPEYKRGAFHLNEKAEPLAASSVEDTETGRAEFLKHYQETVAT